MTAHVNARRRRLLAAGAALCTAGAMTITLIPTSATAAAPKVQSVSISASKAKVTTSKGKSVTVLLTASRVDSPTLNVTLATPSETHGWGFPVTNKEITLANDGRGKIAPALSKTSPFGQINLTIAPAAAAKVTRCDGQAVSKTQKLTVGGTFWFDTRSGAKGWGAVGSKTKPFTFSTSATAIWSYENTAECGGGGSSALCSAATSWGVFGDTTSISGTGRQVLATRRVFLAKPAGTERFDLRMVTAKSATLTEDVKAKTSKLVVVGNGKTLTGNGVFRGSNRMVSSSPCGTAGKRLSTTMWSPVSFKNGKNPLRANDIYGAMNVANSPSAFLMRSKVRS